MEFFTLLLIAVGLSFDSFAVSVSCGLSANNIRINGAFRLASVFALVQGACFLAGCILGQSLHGLISNYDHWVAFSLLSIMGGKMIYESLTCKKGEGEECVRCRSLKLGSTFLMAFATSIDAIIVGFGIALVDISARQLCSAIILIALVTAIAALSGLFIGKKTGKHIGEKADIIGGLVLIIIGSKILIEHLFA